MRSVRGHYYMPSIRFILSGLVLGFSLTILGCDDDDKHLPAPTQAGKRTFGCLVNGKLWLPEGNNGTAKLSLYYDKDFLYGTFNLFAYRITSRADQSIVIFSDSLKAVGDYDLSNPQRQCAFFDDFNTDCVYDQEPQVQHEGLLTITKFDLQNRIISGTFEFKVAMPNCETIEVTDGRFDMKL